MGSGPGLLVPRPWRSLAEVVRVSAPDLTNAAATVAEHLETAARAPTGIAPVHGVASPVDVAASAAAAGIQTKMSALSTEMAPKGPAIQQTGAAAAAALLAQDAANSARLPSVPSVPSPSTSAGRTPTVKAVDNRTFKDAPPDDSGNEGSWRDRPSPPTAKEVQDALGQLQRGDNRPHRQVDTPEEIHDFWDWLTGNSAGHAPSSAPFPRERLEDGTIVSLRPDSKSGGEVIGVTPPGGDGETKVHLPTESPIISGLPQLPGVHGTPMPTQPPTIMPGVPLPASPSPTMTTPSADPGLLPQIGHDLAEAGKKAAIGGLIGVAIIGGLLGIGPAAPQGAS